MNKDIIYIDTEDDITAIIGKIKASKDKVVALVPPKRTGVLQSAVNLRLLARTAKSNEKHLVIITNNKALTALSASAKIPVAKNLQSKPEMPEIAALEVDDGEDIIEGSQLPVGELAKTSDLKPDEDITDEIKSLDIENDDPKYMPPTPIGSAKKSGSGVKIPDFGSFRKKLFIGIGAGVALIIFLIWAIWFAPAATVVITAKTQGTPISSTLTLGAPGSTDVSGNVVQTVTKQIKKTISVDFTPTGKKDVGNKASGDVTIKNCDSSDEIIIPANTVFTASSGERFLSNSQVTVPGLTGSASLCRNTGVGAGVKVVNVSAEEAGTQYNIGASSYTIYGVTGDVYAKGEAMTGGTSRMATVVTQADVQKATEALNDLPTADAKSELTAQFSNGEIVVKDSYTVDRGQPKSLPAVGAETSGKAKLSTEATFTMMAIPKTDLEDFLKATLERQIDKGQRIYSNGIDKVSLSDFQKGEKASTVNIAATGQIGPDIDKEAIKERVKGKRYGDVQTLLDDFKGINNVDVKFSYFWVNTIPKDTKKISVEFVLANE